MADTFEDIVRAVKANPDMPHTFQPEDSAAHVTGKCEVDEAARTVTVGKSVYSFPDVHFYDQQLTSAPEPGAIQKEK